MKATKLSRLLLLLMVACASSMILVWGRGTAWEGIESGRYLVLSEIVGSSGIPLLGLKSMLCIEHHLLVCPLS